MLESIIVSIILFIKIVATLLSLAMILCIILIVKKAGREMAAPVKEILEEARDLGELSKSEARSSWAEIKEKAESPIESDYREAVAMADKFLDEILKTARFSGEGLADRLKTMRDNQLEFKDDIVWADNLKNKIVSDENFKVSQEEAKRAVYIFERALKEIGVL